MTYDENSFEDDTKLVSICARAIHSLHDSERNCIIAILTTIKVTRKHSCREKR